MDKLRKFLELDRKVLRFFCVWDDRDQMFGEIRKFILHVSISLLEKILFGNITNIVQSSESMCSDYIYRATV
jgi:hypothetical protein